MNHLYRNSRGGVMAADSAREADQHAPPNEPVPCEKCHGEGERDCPHCGQDMECEACDGKGTVLGKKCHWDRFFDFHDVTIKDQFRAKVTKPACEWAAEHATPVYLGVAYMVNYELVGEGAK